MGERALARRGRGPGDWGGEWRVRVRVCEARVGGAPDARRPQNCLFDTCNCERSEECLCAALSSYVRACAAQGVLLSGWRDGVCGECWAAVF